MAAREDQDNACLRCDASRTAQELQELLPRATAARLQSTRDATMFCILQVFEPERPASVMQNGRFSKAFPLALALREIEIPHRIAQMDGETPTTTCQRHAHRQTTCRQRR